MEVTASLEIFFSNELNVSVLLGVYVSTFYHDRVLLLSYHRFINSVHFSWLETVYLLPEKHRTRGTDMRLMWKCDHSGDITDDQASMRVDFVVLVLKKGFETLICEWSVQTFSSLQKNISEKSPLWMVMWEWELFFKSYLLEIDYTDNRCSFFIDVIICWVISSHI